MSPSKSLRVVRPGMYRKHPRAELLGIVSGESMAEPQERIDDLSVPLEPFECPTCGAPIFAIGEHGESFECSYETVSISPLSLRPLVS
jgi:hypothetical protein